MRDILSRKMLLVIALAGAGLLLGAIRNGVVASDDPTSPAQSQNPSAGASKTEPAADESSSSIKAENSVVKVFATRRAPDLGKPWTKQSALEVTGSGLVIEGKRILTNAHVVLYASQVQIQGNQAGDKISATVEAFAPGIDLAVLKLDDESFFASHAPLPRANALPLVKDPVMVYGYPTGGNSISITKGIVSRIDFTPYNYGTAGLRVQIDAAINPGNSGGPAVVGDKVVGLAFSILANTQNIGYIIPCEEIDLFLKDIADGHYDGKPAIFDSLQTLENSALRAFLKLDKSVEGIVVHTPFQSDASYPLKQWDVITKIGDTPVDDQGNIRLGDNLKVSFRYMVQKIAKNGKVALTVVRGAKEQSIQLPVALFEPKLIQPLQGTYPPYFIYGPIPFSIATEELVSAISAGNNGAMSNMLSLLGNPLITRRSDRPAFEGEQLVLIPSPLFTHTLSKGYGAPILEIVKTINGIRIKNLRHLVEVIRDARDEFFVIEFFGYSAETLVFQRKDMAAATEDILSDNGIRIQGSPDMLEVWNQTKGAERK